MQCEPLADIYLDTFGVKHDGYFVEVGAFNGVNWSATYVLAKMGWGGLMFEPQKDRYNECKSNYSSHRNITIVHCAILDYNGETNLYLGGSLSTTSEERVEIYQDVWWAKSSRLDLERYEVVSCYTLEHMLEKHDAPKDFEVLIVDVEGAEAQVLSTLGNWKPQIMMVETHEDNEDERLSATAGEVWEIVEPLGYEKVFANYINTVYRRINGE
jgi:FkbM family methyltransferase